MRPTAGGRSCQNRKREFRFGRGGRAMLRRRRSSGSPDRMTGGRWRIVAQAPGQRSVGQRPTRDETASRQTNLPLAMGNGLPHPISSLPNNIAAIRRPCFRIDNSGFFCRQHIAARTKREYLCHAFGPFGLMVGGNTTTGGRSASNMQVEARGANPLPSDTGWYAIYRRPASADFLPVSNGGAINRAALLNSLRTHPP